MGQLQKYREDFTMLLEAGFIAANAADEDTASKLFKAAALLKPESTLPRIGFGYIQLLKLELKQASHTFENILKQEPDNDMCTALLALTKAFNAKEFEQGEKLFKELIQRTQEPTVKTMALSAVEFVEKFVRKNPTPMSTHAPKKKKGK